MLRFTELHAPQVRGRTAVDLCFVLIVSLALFSGPISLCFDGAVATAAAKSSAQKPNQPGVPRRDENDERVLTPGIAVERNIAGGGSHSYEINLYSGQYIHVVLEQQGVDVVVTLLGPDGKKLAEADGPNAMHGPERLAYIAAAPGVYKVKVHPYRDTAPAGRYRVEIEEVREATARDRTRIDAQRLLIECQESWAQGTGDSLRKAISRCEESLPLWKDLRDRQGEADTLYYLGIVSNLLDEYRKAIDFDEKALMLRRALGDRRGEAVLLHNIGLSYRYMGEYQKSLEYYNRAIELVRPIDNYEEMGAFLEATGTIYWLLGENQKALEYLERALALNRANGFRNLEANGLNHIAGVYNSMGEHQKALSYREQALSIWKTIQGSTRQEAITLDGIGAAYAALGDARRAIEYFRRSIALSREAGYRGGEALTLSRMGEAHVSIGEAEQALEEFRSALLIQRAIRAREAESRTLAGLARAEIARGNLIGARQHIESALEIVESLRSNVALQGLRASFLASKESYYKLYIDALMRLHAQQPLAGYDAMALQASERARARSLLEILTEARADIRQGVAPALLERERRLQPQINAKAERLTRLLGGRHTAEQATAARKELDSLLTEYQGLQAEIRTSSPRYAALTQPQPLSVEEIQKQVLDPDTLLLEYSLGDEQSYLWAVTPNSLTTHVLPKRAGIEQAARQVYELLTARNQHPAGETSEQRAARVAQAEAKYAQAAATLTQMVLGPVAAQLGTKRLIVVSEGALQYVPFAALPVPLLVTNQSPADSRKASDARPPTADKYQPLIVEHEVISLPSASVLAVLRREQTQDRLPAPHTVAVLADPVFTDDDPRIAAAKQEVATRVTAPRGGDPGASPQLSGDVKRSATESGVMEFKRLRFSRQEAEVITTLISADEHLKAIDFAANRATATSPEVGRYRILHLATHGLLNSQHPELSGIVLSLVDEHGRPQDGFLRLHEIYNLRLGADLVVLSACQTALGHEIKGEGLVGLTRGFMYAGAPRVVATLWSVDDRATAELMKRFYTALLKNNQRPAAALRAAQVSMSEERRWRSPYYWAAFITQGEWRGGVMTGARL